MGTLVNTGAVILGGLIGLLLKKGLKDSYQDLIMEAIGLAVMFIGIAGALEKMLVIKEGALSSQGAILCTLALAIGALIGEFIDIEGKLVSFGEWLKKTVQLNDSQFLDAFVNTSLTICIGAMAIVGALQDGLNHDPSLLYTKAILDFIIVILFSSTMGVGTTFSAIPIFLWQGGITLFASSLQAVMSTVMINNLSMVGSMLIFVVGVNLFFPYKVKWLTCCQHLL